MQMSWLLWSTAGNRSECLKILAMLLFVAMLLFGAALFLSWAKLQQKRKSLYDRPHKKRFLLRNNSG